MQPQPAGGTLGQPLNGLIGLPSFIELYHILMDQQAVNDELKQFSTDASKYVALMIRYNIIFLSLLSF